MSDEQELDPNELSAYIPPLVSDEGDAIIGGHPTLDFPDCCAVASAEGYTCSGTLIAADLVVTARHCGIPVQVFLNGYDINAAGEEIPVIAAFPHPELDIAVLRLAHPSTVAPRRIARRLPSYVHEALVVGFGTTDTQGKQNYGTKREARIPIVSPECARPGDTEKFGCRAGFELIGGHRGMNRNACSGDSGGPLYIQNDDGEYELIGATSYGVTYGNSKRICGNEAIYVRLDRCREWLSQFGPLVE